MNIRVFRFSDATSTSDLLKQMAACGAGEGAVVVAETQRVGRGRLDHVWQSPLGGLYFSLLLRPALQGGLPLLPLVAALAVAESLRDEFGVQLDLKWPNDLLWGGGKIAGILCESSRDAYGVWLIVGVGINVNTDSSRLPGYAASLREASGQTVDLDYVLSHVVERIAMYYEQLVAGDATVLLERIRAMDALVGREICVAQAEGNVRGSVVGIDETGALLIDTGQLGVVSVLAGEVHVEAIH